MIVPFNIVTTYPVRWSKYNVFRDFIQNFYDSVDLEDWNERFHYEYAHATLKMWVDGVCFSYEWLLHIGASTKTVDSDSNAGYFGEGFKIASLYAKRDYDWEIEIGGDSSNAFSQGLTVAMEILLSQSLRVEFYKEKWVEQFNE